MDYKNNTTEVKLGMKGKTLKGEYSPHGEIMIESAASDGRKGYYIFAWPNDGTKWPDSNEEMVYDDWFLSLDEVKQQIEYEGLEIKWPANHTTNPNEKGKNNHEEKSSEE